MSQYPSRPRSPCIFQEKTHLARSLQPVFRLAWENLFKPTCLQTTRKIATPRVTPGIDRGSFGFYANRKWQGLPWCGSLCLQQLEQDVVSTEKAPMIQTKKFLAVVMVCGMFLAPSATPAGAGDACCDRCPPPPQAVHLCVVDPCTHCSYEITACVPACCACETPCLEECRKGILGRKILTYKWPCGHCIDVVITAHGKTIVRD